ncbi:MAG: winged helix-turn-helix domain-containing protein, partial [Chthoniobacterales bacterium]
MSSTPTPIYEFGDFRLDPDRRLLCREDGAVVPLTARVFETLLYLVEHSGVVLEREQLMEAVWPDAVVEENNLTQNISTLRRVLGETRGSNQFIATVPGRGYRFVAEVHQAAVNGARPAATTAEDDGPDGATAPPAAVSLARSRRYYYGFFAAAALLLLASGLFLVRQNGGGEPRRARPLPSAQSIAVLPFANLSGDPANAYFADGVKDEILTRLSKIGSLKVISGTSTQKFKSAPNNVREIAAQLGVANLLEGSVQRSGDTVRVTVQLIRTESDTHLWAETYDRKIADMFQVETEVAQSIASALAASLTATEERALAQNPTANVEAHHSYLRGRYFWNKRTVDGYRLALTHFKRAIDQDPAYAQAYIGLADAYLFLGGDDAAGQRDAVAKGRAALQRALELDESQAEAHASLGLLALNFDWDWAKAEREFKRALEVNPNYATAHQWYGEFLVSIGRADEGIAEIQKAADLDPLSVVISTDVAKVYMLARRYDEA